jgi:hypothetical protein
VLRFSHAEQAAGRGASPWLCDGTELCQIACQRTECFITGSAAEVTAVSEIADWRFTPGAITKQLMDDYTAKVQPKGKAAAA